jgi:opacity protein-like surface antigen
VAACLFAASPAFAQADPDQPATPSPGGGDDANGTGSGAPSTAAPGATAAGGQVGGAPIIDRPLTLNASKIGAYADLDILRESAGNTSNTSLGLHLGAGYGVSDALTVGLEYQFSLANDFEIKGPLSLYGSYSIFRNDKLTVGLSAALIFDFDAVTFNSDGTTSDSVDVALSLGAGARYKLTPSIALYTGNANDFGATSDVGLVAPSILGSQLLLGFNNGAPVVFQLPIGVAWQATPQVYAFAQTEIFDVVHESITETTMAGTVSVSNTSSNFLFANYIPLEVGGFYTVNKNLDIGAALNFGDLENGVDALAFTIAARYYN